ncbi:hypothetical protein BDV97DRAFT_407762 [Delphinella strobiligena]|nr:hypothetical protein BDV97DRAFT_407762 [Delphinella strobiligena]
MPRAMFQCPLEGCTKEYKHKVSMTRHFLNHSTTGRYHFECPHCTHTSTQNENHEAHIRAIHTGERFKCRYCDYTGAHKYTITRHMRNEHHDPNPSAIGLQLLGPPDDWVDRTKLRSGEAAELPWDDDEQQPLVGPDARPEHAGVFDPQPHTQGQSTNTRLILPKPQVIVPEQQALEPLFPFYTTEQETLLDAGLFSFFTPEQQALLDAQPPLFPPEFSDTVIDPNLLVEDPSVASDMCLECLLMPHDGFE